MSLNGMKPRGLSLVCFASMAFFLPSIAHASEGTLSISSNVVGAAVTIDGKLSGFTPLEDHPISPGAHTITVSEPCSYPREVSVTITPRGKKRLTMKLTPKTATVIFDVKSRHDRAPLDATIGVGGHYVGQARKPVDVVLCDHPIDANDPTPITIRARDHGTVRLSRTLKPGETLKEEVLLAESAVTLPLLTGEELTKLRTRCDEKKIRADCANLAVRYQSGDGLPRDYGTATEFFIKSCALGDLGACFYAAQHMDDTPDSDPAQILSLYTKACDGGAPVACNNIAWLYEASPLFPRDYTRAMEFYVRACNGGGRAGCSGVASMYYYGKGVKKNLSLARTLFGTSCAMKLSDSSRWGCFFLGEMLLAEGNKAKATEMFDLAHDSGITRASRAALKEPLTPPTFKEMIGKNLKKDRAFKNNLMHSGVCSHDAWQVIGTMLICYSYMGPADFKDVIVVVQTNSEGEVTFVMAMKDFPSDDAAAKRTLSLLDYYEDTCAVTAAVYERFGDGAVIWRCHETYMAILPTIITRKASRLPSLTLAYFSTPDIHEDLKEASDNFTKRFNSTAREQVERSLRAYEQNKGL